ncbi:hypothetical protein [Haliscomenobacter sp.]|uniref:hypothetical protein n=1 Tax=Haliscomenobacter sp. TaxID=2717303 RepID=UPI0035940401
MKRIGNLFEQFVAFPNLLQAYYKARKGSRRNQENSFFFVNLEAELLQLQEELQSLTYAPQPYRYIQIYDPKLPQRTGFLRKKGTKGQALHSLHG